MLATNFSNVRENFKDYCDRVNDGSETVIITRKNNKNVVLLSLKEYNNMMENLKVLQNPEYFIELYESIRQVERGQTHRYVAEDSDK